MSSDTGTRPVVKREVKVIGFGQRLAATLLDAVSYQFF